MPSAGGFLGQGGGGSYQDNAEPIAIQPPYGATATSVKRIYKPKAGSCTYDGKQIYTTGYKC
jgi:hypothetical protein